MNTTGMRATVVLCLAALGLAMAPASAERYLVEPLATPLGADAEEGFSQAELDQLLAPIALYPDGLLSQVLVAATYPLEIVEAARWSRQNPQLQGEAAVAAVADRSWDPSVKALVAFPDLLARLDEDLEWTRQVGDAMLFQETQVMDSIQFLRARADAAGNLKDTEQVRIIREEKTIVIEPAQPRVVYVPYYDPWVIYGTWWRPAYPPVVWVRPSHYYYGYPGFYWSPGIHVSTGFFYTGFYWPQRSVIIVNTPRYYVPPRHRPARYTYAPGQRWQHNPVHRRGVQYRHVEVRNRYAQRPAERSAYRATERGSYRPPERGSNRLPEHGSQRPTERTQVPSHRGSAREGLIRDGSGSRDSRETRSATRDRSTDRVADAMRTTRQPGMAPSLRSAEVARNLQSTRSPPASRTVPSTRPQPAQRSQVIQQPQAVQRSEAAPRAQASPRSQATPPRQSIQRSEAAPRPQSTQRSQAAPRTEPAPRSRALNRAEAPARESRSPGNASRGDSSGRDSRRDGGSEGVRRR